MSFSSKSRPQSAPWLPGLPCILTVDLILTLTYRLISLLSLGLPYHPDTVLSVHVIGLGSVPLSLLFYPILVLRDWTVGSKAPTLLWDWLSVKSAFLQGAAPWWEDNDIVQDNSWHMSFMQLFTKSSKCQYTMQRKAALWFRVIQQVT